MKIKKVIVNDLMQKNYVYGIAGTTGAGDARMMNVKSRDGRR